MPNNKWKKTKGGSDHFSATVYNLLNILDVPATFEYVDKVLQEHPDYPSVLTMAESLPEWKVNSEGVKGKIGDLSEIDYPSIVHLSSNYHNQNTLDFAVLEDMSNGDVTILHSAEGRRKLGLAEFSNMWSGILLRASPNTQSGEPDYSAHLKSHYVSRLRSYLTIIGLPALFLLAFSYGLAQVGSWGTLIPLGLAKAIGLVFCIVMAAANLGEGGMMKTLCPMGKVVNCHRVMLSPAGRILGVSMAELGLLYFSGGLLSLLAAFFFGNFTNDLFFIGILSAFALPYTFFSISYQAFVVRSWCWMCLVIQAIFWIEFYLLFDNTINRFAENIGMLKFPLSLVLGFGGATLIWIALRHVIISSQKAKAYEYMATRLRRQPDYIQLELSKSRSTDMGQMPLEVEVGPADAEIAMTLVVNPLCGHCWRAFKQMDQIIEIGQGKIRANIRFLVSGEDPNQNATEKMLDREVSLGILQLAEQGDRDKVRQALRGWFSEDGHFSRMKFDRWTKIFPRGNGNSDSIAIKTLSMQREWATRNKIMSTPTLFLGNRRLMNGLQLEDLKIFLIRQSDRP